MGFQIKDKDGNAIPIIDLDKEAAEFWGNEVHHKYYAKPGPSDEDDVNLNESWFDLIGFLIHSIKAGKVGWDDVVGLMVGHAARTRTKDDGSLNIVYFVPYIRLINHWKDKGYVGYSVQD